MKDWRLYKTNKLMNFEYSQKSVDLQKKLCDFTKQEHKIESERKEIYYIYK